MFRSLRAIGNTLTDIDRNNIKSVKEYTSNLQLKVGFAEYEFRGLTGWETGRSTTAKISAKRKTAPPTAAHGLSRPLCDVSVLSPLSRSLSPAGGQSVPLVGWLG